MYADDAIVLLLSRTATIQGKMRLLLFHATYGGSTDDFRQGLWMKHVQYFLDSANDTSITNKYTDFLGSQYAAVHHNALNVVKDVGSVWYAPNEGGSEWGPQASASGLEAVLSAAKVCVVRMFDRGDRDDCHSCHDLSMRLVPLSTNHTLCHSFFGHQGRRSIIYKQSTLLFCLAVTRSFQKKHTFI